MSYYIEGTIESIELAMDCNAHFALLPSPEFLKTIADGKKKALFIKQAEEHSKHGGGEPEENSKQTADETEKDKSIVDTSRKDEKGDKNPIPALLINTTKNETEKETLQFLMPNRCLVFRSLLLEAKNNRNTGRVFAKSAGIKPEDLTINFAEPATITIL